MQQLKSAAVRSIISSFKEGIPFLRFGEGNEALVLAYRKRGEEIDDPDCDNLFEALQQGVFKRCLKISGDRTEFVYLYFAPLTDEYLDDALSPSLEALPPEVLETIPYDCAFQVMRWNKAQERSSTI